MAKILLVKSSEYVYPFAVTHPLGLMYLSACLKREGGHEIRIIDTRVNGRPKPEQIRDEAVNFAPDIIGLSALMMEAGNFHNIAAALKNALPRTPVLAGGPYPSSCPERTLKDTNIACAVMGEGEETLLEIAGLVDGKLDFSQVPGTVSRENGGLKTAPPRPFIQNLDSLPFPDWDAVDLPAYSIARRFSNYPPGPYMPIFTSRSCPYNCIYCHKIFGKKFRSRGPENVFSEIRTIVDRYGIAEIEIIDDTFNMDRARAEAILDLIISSGLKLKLLFPNAVRADILDEELVRKMKAAGTIYTAVAIESASPRMQKLIRKNLNIEKTRLAIRNITRAGIFCHGYFMFGFPTETAEEMEKTIRFACRSKLHTAGFFMVKPAPGTELHDMISARGASEPEFNLYSYHSTKLTASELPQPQLMKIYRSAFIRFYFNPARLIRVTLLSPNKKFLLKAVPHLLHRLFFSVITRYTPDS